MAERLSSADIERLKGVAATEQSAQLGSVRLSALLQEPERLIDLDQRDYLGKTGKDDRLVVDATLALPKRLFPHMFGDAAVSNTFTAICLTDGRLFLWERLEGVDVLAMVPLKGTNHRRDGAQSFKVWLCASGDNATSEWRQRQKSGELVDWLQTCFQNLAGANIQFSGNYQKDQGVKKIQGVLVADRSERRVSISVAQRLLGIEMTLNADELDGGFLPSPQMLESKKIPKKPFLAPTDWPPKQINVLDD